jgi:hypothetical protein
LPGPGLEGLPYSLREKYSDPQSGAEISTAYDLRSKQLSTLRANTKGIPWSLPLLPLSGKEKRKISKLGHWPKSLSLPSGDYNVAPTRDSIQLLSKKFWIYRELNAVLRIILLNPLESLRETLFWIRAQVLKYLHTDAWGLSKEQSSTLAQTYYCLRQLRPSRRRR